MSKSKVFWAGVAGGALLIGAAFGAAWQASGQRRGVLSRAFEGASHASKQLSPVSGLSPVLDRMQQAGSLAKGETDLGAGLPDEPTPDGEALPGTSIQSNTGDAAPIVIPEGGPPMPRVNEEDEALPMPRLLLEDGAEEEQEAASCLGEAVRGFLLRLLLPSPAVEPEPFPEAEMPEATKPEMRESPNKPHQDVCPSTGKGYCPRQGVEAAAPASPALEKVRKLRGQQSVDGAPAARRYETLELRESDRMMYEYGPGAL